jgi:hypothetical protein
MKRRPRRFVRKASCYPKPQTWTTTAEYVARFEHLNHLKPAPLVFKAA